MTSSPSTFLHSFEIGLKSLTNFLGLQSRNALETFKCQIWLSLPNLAVAESEKFGSVVKTGAILSNCEKHKKHSRCFDEVEASVGSRTAMNPLT